MNKAQMPQIIHLPQRVRQGLQIAVLDAQRMQLF